MTASVLAGVAMAPRDPILGITEAFNADDRAAKVNLGVGVYYDESGRIPLLECVRRAEERLVAAPRPRGYLPIDGMPAYDLAVRELVFGADHPAVVEGRVLTVQTLGGTGGLKVGADFLRRFAPRARVWISEPSWENHRALFESAGFTVSTYPYYDAATKGLRFAAMLEGLRAVPAGDVVVLHACCHNPTGVDLSPAQWAQVREVVQARELVAFLDLAYQGFAEGVDADAAAVRAFAAALHPVFVASSFSKSFSLYGERVGALSLVAGSADEGARALSQLKRIVRTNYSNPPTHGGQVVATVLNDAELRRLWGEELAGMRERIRRMREKLAALLAAKKPGTDFGFITRQRGMFSYSGLTQDQVAALRERFAIYAVDSGRICVAALNERNIEAVASAVAAV
ncbi:MAG: aromatic amino acid aminotransferase [Polyangiaceae bacterium UTPRO1]|jgi:aromatic-amino-acid transaminase|nr:aspartate/tyrosine/aromatic aminotransferase [Myxococcales bacterium]OQY68454.1 MAG: aromatic amino acid aminotransferase [Polyangiaceae bacterium UTPRO1]